MFIIIIIIIDESLMKVLAEAGVLLVSELKANQRRQEPKAGFAFGRQFCELFTRFFAQRIQRGLPASDRTCPDGVEREVRDA